MELENRAVVFDAQSVRFEEWNGHLRVNKTKLTKANVCEYYGWEIANHKQYGFDPNKRYRLLRSPDALKAAVQSFSERPIQYVHKAADADKLDNGKVIGTTGSDPSFEFPYITDAITIWDGDYIKRIKNGEQAELSASYAFTPVIESGEFEGQPYDAIMTDIHVDHIALVEQGRAGPDVRVADSKPKQIHFKGKEMATKLNKTGQALFSAITSEFNNGRANDSNSKDIASLIGKAAKSKKSKIPEVISSLLVAHSIANDEDTGRIEETVKNAMDEDTDCKAQDSDDPVDTLEANDEEDDKNPTVGDEDDKDKKTDVSDEDQDDKKDKENRASDAAGEARITKKIQDTAKANDAAIKSEIDRYKREVKLAREAEKIVRPLVGELSIVSDSASDYYETAIKMITGSNPPKGTPVSSLRFMVENLKSNQQQSIASDSATKPTNDDWSRIGASHLGNVKGY